MSQGGEESEKIVEYRDEDEQEGEGVTGGGYDPITSRVVSVSSRAWSRYIDGIDRMDGIELGFGRDDLTKTFPGPTIY